MVKYLPPEDPEEFELFFHGFQHLQVNIAILGDDGSKVTLPLTSELVQGPEQSDGLGVTPSTWW